MHTVESDDAHTRLDELVPMIQNAGLDGLAITNHNKLITQTPSGALIIPGIEISSHDGHIIGLGVTEAVPRGLSGDETIRRISELGGVSIVAHPYDLFRSAIRLEALTTLPDAIEVINSASIFHSLTWKRAKSFASKKSVPQTGGSDSHIPQTIGKAYTLVDSDSRTVEAVLSSIRRGAVSPYGRPYGFGDRFRKLMWRQ